MSPRKTCPSDAHHPEFGSVDRAHQCKNDACPTEHDSSATKKRKPRKTTKVLKNFNHSVGPAAIQAGTKGIFTHSSGIPSRFASLHDVPCLQLPSAGFAWVSTCSHQLVTRRLVSSRCKPVKREFTSRTEDLPDTAAKSMPRLSQDTSFCQWKVEVLDDSFYSYRSPGCACTSQQRIDTTSH